MVEISSGDVVAGETSWITWRIAGCLRGEEHSDSPGTALRTSAWRDSGTCGVTWEPVA